MLGITHLLHIVQPFGQLSFNKSGAYLGVRHLIYRRIIITLCYNRKGKNFLDSSNSLKEDSLLNPKTLKWSNSSTLKLEGISNISYELQRLIFVTGTVRNLTIFSAIAEGKSSSRGGGFRRWVT